MSKTNVTPELIANLPKWAQQHIANISRERDTAIRTLEKSVDQQTKSPFYFETYDCLGTNPNGGPTSQKHYVQTNCVVCEYRGVELRVLLRQLDEHEGIEISWGTPDRACREVAFIPKAFQQAVIKAEVNTWEKQHRKK